MLGFAFKPEPRASGQDAKTGWGGGVGSLVLLVACPSVVTPNKSTFFDFHSNSPL